MQGRKPLPPRLKLLEGNPGHRPLPEGIRAAPRAPKMPVWRSLFPTASGGPAAAEARLLARDAAAEWRRIVPELDRLGVLSTLDAALLVDYCVSWARLRQCERMLARDGLTVLGERGVQRHPALSAANQYRAALRGYLVELGLTPASRARITPAGPLAEGDSPFDV